MNILGQKSFLVNVEFSQCGLISSTIYVFLTGTLLMSVFLDNTTSVQCMSYVIIPQRDQNLQSQRPDIVIKMEEGKFSLCGGLGHSYMIHDSMNRITFCSESSMSLDTKTLSAHKVEPGIMLSLDSHKLCFILLTSKMLLMQFIFFDMSPACKARVTHTAMKAFHLKIRTSVQRNVSAIMLILCFQGAIRLQFYQIYFAGGKNRTLKFPKFPFKWSRA